MNKGFTLGEIIIPDGVFLGAQELTRHQLFLGEKFRLLLTLGGKGILGKEDFIVQAGQVPGTISLPESLAIDHLGNLIYKREQVSLSVPEGSFWLGCKTNKTSLEKGTVSLSVVGNGGYMVNGVGTEFTKLFRGLTGQYKTTKISFEKLDTESFKNTGIYTVLQVISDTQLVLVDPIYPETNLAFRSIQTFEQDLLPSEEKRSIYKNYGCDLVIIPEGEEGQKPLIPETLSNVWEEDIFCIASIQNTGGVVTVVDRRETFYIKLEEFVKEETWTPLVLSSGTSQSLTEPLSIRFGNFSNKVEIKGKFKTSASGNTAVCQLPEKYRPETEETLQFIMGGTFSIGVLKVGTDGTLKLLSPSFAISTEDNYIFTQTLTLR